MIQILCRGFFIDRLTYSGGVVYDSFMCGVRACHVTSSVDRILVCVLIRCGSSASGDPTNRDLRYFNQPIVIRHLPKY